MKKAKININALEEELKEISYFTRGLTFKLVVVDKDKIETKSFKSENGLADALDKKERIHTNILSYVSVVDDVKVEFALQWTKNNGGC